MLVAKTKPDQEQTATLLRIKMQPQLAHTMLLSQVRVVIGLPS